MERIVPRENNLGNRSTWKKIDYRGWFKKKIAKGHSDFNRGTTRLRKILGGAL
jgi:hypothetical protein